MVSEPVQHDSDARVEALCAALDREYLWARTRTAADGRTPLERCRELWALRAARGLPLPERWSRDEEEAEVLRRLARHGTREWRRAHPELVEVFDRAGGAR